MSNRDNLHSLQQLISALPPEFSSETVEQIRRAYLFAEQAHAGHHRPSGERAIDYALAVALTLCELGLDGASIMAALLHDTIRPESGLTEKELAKQFGARVAGLVAALRNLHSYASGDGFQKQSEADNFNKIQEAILDIIKGDIRVILLRMAIALQDLRKAGELPEATRRQLAHDVMDIFAPLANRLGVWQLKWQMEDLAFRNLQPTVYGDIARRIDERQAGRNEKLNEAIQQLQSSLNEVGIVAKVAGRPKHIYSIYRKMERKGVPFDEIYDVQALRVIIDTTNIEQDKSKSRKHKDRDAFALCYQALGIVHSLWQPIQREFDDYIASPKPNGYRSLHTAVMDETGQTLEVQIRTDLMDEEAERGIAAHWAYKEGGDPVSGSLQKKIRSFRQLLEELQEDELSNDRELIRKEALGERIYVFTPHGDVIDLPAGATPIDFAYHIHTQVGHRCRSAKVNGKMVSLDHQLHSGDRVEIITSSRGGPNRDWMNESLGYAASARTRARIRQWFRQQEHDQNVIEGRRIVERELKRLGLSDVFTLEDIAAALRQEDVEQFLARVGFGDIQSSQLGGAIASLQQKLKPDDELLPLLEPQRKLTKELTVMGVSGLATKLAGCCNPIPPQPIVGYITRGSGVTIHQKDCKTLALIEDRDRVIETVEWGVEQDTYPVPIVIRAYQRPGLVEEISNILKGRKINAPKTKKTTANSVTTIYMVAEVPDMRELNWLLQRIEKLPNVLEVRRQRWSD